MVEGVLVAGEDAVVEAPVGNRSTDLCSGSEAGSYLRLIDSCITQLKAQGPSRTCNESQEEEEYNDECQDIQELQRRKVDVRLPLGVLLLYYSQA